MKIPGIDNLWRAGRQLAGRSAQQAIVLLYHRVIDLRPDPWSLCVAPQHFAEHIEVLRRYSRPMSLRQLIQALEAGKLPPRSVVVTFDDGYADNFHNARPVLARHDVPATIFVATGNTGQQREFWWDELERLLLRPGNLPADLSLSIAGASYHWELGSAVHYSEDAFERDRNWIAWGEQHPTARHALYYTLWELLHPLAEHDRQQVLADLAAWSGAEACARPTHRTMTRAEVAALARDGLIEVGAHTVTHPTLAALPAARQREEINQSKAALEQITDRPIVSFSYPFGRRSDYTAETVAIVRGAGFAGACSNFAGVVGRSTDHFQLPRVNVPDCDGEAFARQLNTWFDGQ